MAECKLMMSAAGRLAAAAATAAASYASPATRQFPATLLCWWSAVCFGTTEWQSCRDEQPSASWHASNGSRLRSQSWLSLPSDAGWASICPWTEWLQVRPCLCALCACGFAVKYALWLTIMYAFAIHTHSAAVYGKTSCWMSCMLGSTGRRVLAKFELAVVTHWLGYKWYRRFTASLDYTDRTSPALYLHQCTIGLWQLASLSVYSTE